ncbi:glycosyltransferase [Pseudarthrobacter sp. PvP090]|uniref:glycosyltransferase n=1 Tax=Pseudarthrobacter sp. PvP090 TaxID=3156393 RepID=UPI0033990CDD
MNATKLRIRILGLHYSPEPSGNAPYTSSLAEGLTKAGHDVEVFTGFPHYPEWRIYDGYSGWRRRELLNGVKVTRLRHYVPRKPSALRRLTMEMTFGFQLLFARWGRPDVVLLVSPALLSTAIAVLRARLSPSKPAVAIWVQDLYSRGLVETSGAGDATARLAAALEGLILGSAHGVVVIHERFKKYLVDSLNVDGSSISIIRNWTHLPDAPTSGQAAFRERFGWLPEDFIVLHAGNMGKKQGLENVINAARHAEEKGSSVKFVLMGDGNQRQSLEASASGARNLIFIDSLADADFQMALTSADALLVNELPGVKDMSVPSKLTSYFNASVPVIAATDEGSVTAFEVESSCGGVRVNSADPSALVEAAELLGRDPDLSTGLGKRGLRYRHETLSEASAIRHYDDVITSLASSRSR